MNPISPEEFSEKFKELIDRLWLLQERIGELKEFEKQWKAFFDLLKQKTGKECSIYPRSGPAYRNYRWDKYHVLISDTIIQGKH